MTITGSPVEITSVPGRGTFGVEQSGPSGSIALTISCTSGAAATISPMTAPVGGATTTVTVTASAAPTSNPPPQHACTVSVMGGGGQTQTVPVDITSANATIMNHGRR